MPSEPLQDPSEYFNESLPDHFKRMPGVEGRLDVVTGRHKYEICLYATYNETKRFLKSHSRATYHSCQRHIYDLKANVLRYCLSVKIDPEEYLLKPEGFIIVKPDVESALYFEMLSNQLFITQPEDVKWFLDFHFYNATNKATKSVERWPFIKQIQHHVLFRLTNNLPWLNGHVIAEVRGWVNDYLSNLNEKQMASFYGFKFRPKDIFGGHPEIDLIQKLKPHGSDEITIRKYFHLLLNAHPCGQGKVSFVTRPKLDQILKEWFRIGEDSYSPEALYSITRNQLLYFVHQFHIHCCYDKGRDTLNLKDLLRLCQVSFPSLFEDSKNENLYKNLNRRARQGHHENLDWRNDKYLKSHIESKKT